MAQLRKFLIYVEYRCPLQVWGKTAKENEWMLYKADEAPKIGQLLDNNCGEPYYLEACNDGNVYCEEKGRVSKVEEFSPKRAKQLRLEEKVSIK